MQGLSPVYDFAAYLVNTEAEPLSPDLETQGADAAAPPAATVSHVPPAPTQLRTVTRAAGPLQPLREVVEVTPQELAAMLGTLSRQGALGSILTIGDTVIVGELVGMAVIEAGSGIVPGHMAAIGKGGRA